MVGEWNSEEKIQILAVTAAFIQSGYPIILIYSDILWTFFSNWLMFHGIQ